MLPGKGGGVLPGKGGGVVAGSVGIVLPGSVGYVLPGLEEGRSPMSAIIVVPDTVPSLDQRASFSLAESCARK